MSRLYDRPITIQRINEKTEDWEPVYNLHARINKSNSENQYMSAGSSRTQITLTFEVRYFKKLEDIRTNLQGFRIVYLNNPYYLEDYDDYMMTHKTVKFLGVMR